MKRKLTLFIASLFVLCASGQDVKEQEMLGNVNWSEDSTEMTTISDIIKQQQDLTSSKFRESHYRDVWSRKSYINLSYNSTTLTPDQTIKTGVGEGVVPEFKSDWGASLQIGRSYALHKRPIANILQFNLDYTFIDFNVNHFKHEGDGTNLYDSSARLPEDNTKYFTPWNLDKFDFNYAMSLGPSISIAPFTYTGARGLHHLKFNVWFHFGYNVSMLWMQNDGDADVSKPNSATDNKPDYEKMKENAKLDLGHGITYSFGASVTWKFIGIGYESRSSKLEYKSLSKSDFGSEKYKFKSTVGRVFLQFRL